MIPGQDAFAIQANSMDQQTIAKPDDVALAACLGKKRHATFREATKALSRIRRKWRADVYRCPFCQGYHYGSAFF